MGAAQKRFTETQIEQANADIVGTISRYVQLNKRGHEFVACCPFHKERTPSFTVSPVKGIYHCFGCGANGDAIGFVREFEGKTFPDAIEAILGAAAAGTTEAATKRAAPARKEPAWKAMRFAPDNAPEPPTSHWRLGKPSRFWPYHDAEGRLVGYAVRFDSEAGKEVLPLSWRINTDTGEQDWRWMAMEAPRPLYGSDLLASNPDRPVMVVEGEKTADAARAVFKSFVVVSWPGGGKAVDLADWSQLAGRKVTLWPDWDWKPYKENHPEAGKIMPVHEQPGVQAMRLVFEAIHGAAGQVRIVQPMDGCPDGWDLADPWPVDGSPIDWAKANVIDAASYFAPPPAEEPAPLPPPPPANDNAPAMSDEAFERSGFTILGYDRDVIFIFPHEAKQIKTLTKGDLTENGLLSIASIHFWEIHFPKEKARFDRTAAVDWLFRTAYERGVFNPDRIRGRGAWRDRERVVYHLGDRLHVDGHYMPITKMASQFIYQAERPFPRFDDVPPLTSEEGEDLMRLASMFRWSVPASAALLVGWCVLAPVCGALQWRPHIWITGGPGSGKSTVIDRFAQTLLGPISVFAQGNSTEAGLRQTLRGDALPVLVDESEQNNDKETARMQAVLSLIRQASSESGAKTYKGTTAGTGMQFHIRSMFCLASIQVGIQQQADRERLTILAMREKPEGGAGEHDAKQWQEIKAALYRIERDHDISRKLLHRTMSMMPVLLQSIDVFVQAAAEHFGNQRTGDQYGTLLAGAWCLTASRVPTYQEAAESIASFDWNEYTEAAKGSDSDRALRTLLDSRIRTSHGAEYTVFELVDRVADIEGVDRSGMELPACQMELAQCQAALQRYGMKVIKKQLMLASSSEALGRLFTGTQFAADYRGLLSRVPCVSKSNEPAWIAGKTVKCLAIPLGDIV